ncbi:MAG: ClbS/DfsB family four-helix bundle protein [Patulibacter sp.]
MPAPLTREELETQVRAAHRRLSAELADVERAGESTLPCADDWTVKDVVAVRVAWAEMTRRWIEAGLRGEHPPTPAAGYSWRDTPRLNAAIVARERETPLAALRDRLDAAVDDCLDLAARLDGPDLLEVHRYTWTRSWPIVRWIHANTTAQQTSALRLIRRARRTAQDPSTG